jgi:hypothetical protein
MTMRSVNGNGFCEKCEMYFAKSPDDPKGTVRHPSATQWPNMPPNRVEKYSKCPNAGKLFKHPAMEEVEESDVHLSKDA